MPKDAAPRLFDAFFKHSDIVGQRIGEPGVHQPTEWFPIIGDRARFQRSQIFGAVFGAHGDRRIPAMPCPPGDPRPLVVPWRPGCRPSVLLGPRLLLSLHTAGPGVPLDAHPGVPRTRDEGRVTSPMPAAPKTAPRRDACDQRNP